MNHLEAGQSHPTRGTRLKQCLLMALMVAGTLLSVGAQTPLNDSFSDQPILEGATNVVSIASGGATAESGEPAHAGNPATASVWWTWIAPDSGPVVIDTFGSDFDTSLAVYAGDQLTALVPVAANDDAPNLPTSVVAFSAEQGTHYRIAVDGYLGATGAVRLRVRMPVRPAAPVIVRQPVSLIVPEATTDVVGFSVAATGSLPLKFHWQRAGLDLPAGTNANLVLTPFSAALAGDYRVIISNPYGSVTSSVVVLTALAETGHDRFADRVVIPGTSFAGGAHNLGATTEAGEPVHAGAASGASLWWAWTAPNSGLVRVDTAGSTNSAGSVLDTVLAVYTGSGLEALVPVAANDDQRFGGVVSSEVHFRATAGVTYLVAAAGRTPTDGIPATGFIALNLKQAADNDRFANALPFPPGAIRVFDDNRGASAEPGEPKHTGQPGGRSVWWSWVAPATGTYALDTVGSAIDAVLAVYTGDAIDALALVGEDDNRSGDGASLVKFVATAGTAYRIVVDGFTGPAGIETGAIVLNLNSAQVLNDDFAERVTLAGQTNRITASNISASKQTGEPNHGNNVGGRSLWWTWTARLDGPVVVTTRYSTFDTILAVYTGSDLAALTLVAENEDSDPLNPGAGSMVVFPAVAGRTYQIAVDGYRSTAGSVEVGTIELLLAQPTPPQLGGNDSFAHRFALSGPANIGFGQNIEATKEIGEPNHSGNDGGKSVWWSWVAPKNGPVEFGVVGRDFHPTVAAYQGASVETLTSMGGSHRGVGGSWNDVPPSLASKIEGLQVWKMGRFGWSSGSFEATQGVEYVFAVDGVNDGGRAGAGEFLIKLQQFDPDSVHANDDFAHASPITMEFPQVHSSNFGATRESGEPHHDELGQGHSVWYVFESSENGPVKISTEDSHFDTVIAVYTGAELETLSMVAEDDDMHLHNSDSQVTFEAMAGVRYFIAVDGYASQMGFFTLTLTPLHKPLAAPWISKQPEAQTRFAQGDGGGSNVSFQVIAVGEWPLKYQWFRNQEPLTGATNNLLTITNVGPSVAGAYSVQIANKNGSIRSSAAELTILDAPYNDDFAARISATGSSNVLRGSVLGATKQPGEANHGAELGGRSVWWKWVAPSNGPVEMTTSGSNFDTLLAVYAGGDFAGLRRVAQNDDAVREQPVSRVIFDALAGQEYAVAVDAFKTNGTAGDVVLTIVQPPPKPSIRIQPARLSSVPVVESNFSLSVTVEGDAGFTRFQWYFNGEPIRNATNTTYAFGPLSRARSGVYSVNVANEFGSTVSDDAQVWVHVPQVLERPQVLPDGKVRLRFADPDGTLAANPGRFEVRHTSDLGIPEPTWVLTPGEIILRDGRWELEDRTSGATEPVRVYRVIER